MLPTFLKPISSKPIHTYQDDESFRRTYKCVKFEDWFKLFFFFTQLNRFYRARKLTEPRPKTESWYLSILSEGTPSVNKYTIVVKINKTANSEDGFKM